MLEFNQWFFVLLANFLVLLVILTTVLFRPLAKILKEREKVIGDALGEARSMTAKKDDAIAKMNAELLAARNNAKAAYSELREAGLAQQKEVLSKTEQEAVAMIEKARKELQGETEKARAALKADVEKFSDEIVRKLVNV